jgi:undecaprenyl-diphosphatase
MPLKSHCIRKTGSLLLLVLFLTSEAQSPELKLLKSVHGSEMRLWDASMRGISYSVNPLIPVTIMGIWSNGYFKKDKMMMRNGYKSAISIGFAAITSAGLKILINRPRPNKQYPQDIFPRTHAGPYSFPSGHTTSAFAMATALSLSYQKWYVAVPSYLYAGFVGYSRLRLGVHFPSDVLGGVIIGLGSGLLVWKLDALMNH